MTQTMSKGPRAVAHIFAHRTESMKSRFSSVRSTSSPVPIHRRDGHRAGNAANAVSRAGTPIRHGVTGGASARVVVRVNPGVVGGRSAGVACATSSFFYIEQWNLPAMGNDSTGHSRSSDSRLRLLVHETSRLRS